MLSYITLLEYNDVTDPQVKNVYDEIRAELGFGIVPNLFKSMASHPGFLAAQWQKFRAVILHGEVPRTLKEMIGVVISQANGSEYALRVHLHSLSALGISEDILQLLVQDFESCPLPQHQKEAIRFSLAAATQPRSVAEADYARLREIGLSSAEIMELVATANLFASVNQYTDSIMLEIDTL
ncbi:MAG: carboxymuconolactone decarboxylase family protein [Caldilineaceae bacterium]|nr:carboxymuconolactone decarboxylase family protein [Caldilineaceae bacterium]